MEPLAIHHAFHSAVLCFACATPFLQCYAVLRYAMLCYAMLRYAMLCCAMLCCAMLCYAMLCYAMLCYAMLRYAMLCYAMLCYAMLCYATPCYAMLRCAMLCCAMLCNAMLCHAMLFCFRRAPWTHAVLLRLDERPCCHWLPVPTGQCAPLTAAVPAHSAPERHKQQIKVGTRECKNQRDVRSTPAKQTDQCQVMAR